jgi:hypothetical protein
MEIVEGDEAVGMLTVIFTAFRAAHLEGMWTCFMEADEGTLLFVFPAVHVQRSLP